MLMPFGKYKGMEIEDMPQYYLEWMIDNIEMYPELEQAVLDVINAREAAKHPDLRELDF